jgi:hypothetical protein
LGVSCINATARAIEYGARLRIEIMILLGPTLNTDWLNASIQVRIQRGLDVAETARAILFLLGFTHSILLQCL